MLSRGGPQGLPSLLWENKSVTDFVFSLPTRNAVGSYSDIQVRGPVPHLLPPGESDRGREPMRISSLVAGRRRERLTLFTYHEQISLIELYSREFLF